VLRQLFRERDEGIKRPSLLSRERAEGGGERTASEGVYIYLEGRDGELPDTAVRERLGLL
jgi:hypothetical protein